MFDYHRTEKLCFVEFINGIAKFTKKDLKSRIVTLFKLYDSKQNNFIAKEEFIKMLFNYPKDDIKALYKEIEEFVPHFVNTSNTNG